MKLRSMLVVAVLLCGCSSSTVIHTKPEGAKFFVNGNYLGDTPYKYSDDKLSGSHTYFTLEKAGFDTYHGVLVKWESVNVPCAITGFLIVPLCWVMTYDPEHTFLLQETEAPVELRNNLTRLHKMLEDSVITKDQYEVMRKKAIDDNGK